MKWPWKWSCLRFMEIAMAEEHRRDCTTAVSQSPILGAGIIMQGYHPSFHVNSPPTRQQKSPEEEASLFASRDPSWLCIACQVYSLLLDPAPIELHELLPFLTAQQGTAIMGPSSVLYFHLSHQCSPRVAERWWGTFSVCQLSANGQHKGCRKVFWGPGYEQHFSDPRTWMPSTWRRG